MRLSLAAALGAAGFISMVSAETLTILHTNDFHSRIESISKYDSGCSAVDKDAGKCFGGSARLITAVRGARAASNNSIPVDGGDGYVVFAENAMNAYDFGPSAEDVVVNYLQANAPYTPYMDGRIASE